MRDSFSTALVKLASDNKSLLLLTGDHGYSLFDEFRARFPDQYLNAGVAEQNMVGMAAGLARVGFRPIVYGLSAFVPIRTVEQIKLDITHDNLPVVLIGDGAGFVYSHLGTSHQSTEDIACTRAIPGIVVLSPADRFEMTACMEYAFSNNGPVYMRIGKSDVGDVHNEFDNSLIGRKLIKVFTGNDNLPGIIATGSMVYLSKKIGQEFSLNVWSAPIIKPMDKNHIIEICKITNGLIVLEEHSIYGGLGSAIAEIVSENLPSKVFRIGVNDKFSEKCGSYSYLLQEHLLDYQSVKQRVMKIITSN